jgi:hypothetical protein
MAPFGIDVPKLEIVNQLTGTIHGPD